MDSDSQQLESAIASPMKTNGNTSQNLFPESPVYEPEDDLVPAEVILISDESRIVISSDSKDSQPSTFSKRKLSDGTGDQTAKIQKLDLTNEEFTVSSQTLDEEVSAITGVSKRKGEELAFPSISKVKTPAKSSPRKVKRSNSTETKPKTPRTPKSRPASADITKSRGTPRKLLPTKEVKVSETSDSSSSRPSVEFVSEIPAFKKVPETIEEENSEQNDSQNFHLELTDSPEYSNGHLEEKSEATETIVVKEDVKQTNKSQTVFKGKTSDQESTDSVGSIGIESPEHMPTVASKLISKLSNGNSSTPTEVESKHDGNENTPDMAKLGISKGKRGKNESFRVSNTTTPSTISPLQNGHSLPMNTPQTPVFDVHLSYNEDCEFLSLVVVRTDNDVGMDICKEYQRISKRFTIDPYLGDVSVSNSPSSVTSGGMIQLPNRTSFASTVSSTSTTSSNRTSDGNFVVPQPPRKSVSNPTMSVKGYDSLLKKIQDIFSHIRETSVDEGNRSLNEEKVSVGIQTSLSDGSTNGNASPEEVSKCDKATPKSSLKKTRVKGRRHIAGKTKRALLPTQQEEPEYMHGMNSPEMVPSNSGNGNISPIKSPKDEKPLSSLVATPKSVNKLKQKKRPNSPRPATPVEKSVLKSEYPGYPPDTVVLAKWVDKRYYSGKVLEITDLNKYLIRFDDGQTKVLLDDFIIFGDTKTLPLKGQSVYAMMDEDQNYEPGLVLDIEENESGTVTYKCTTDGDTMVIVTASELYLTEDQARALEGVGRGPPAVVTPRRRGHRELDLDNIIQGPRSARSRDKGSSSARKRVASPKSPKASTSGMKSANKATPAHRRRLASESSEMSESSNSAPPARIEEVAGVEPEVQRTPRKIDGVKAGPLQLKGAAKQNIGKKNSKLTKFENDEVTVSQVGPIPSPNSKIFAGMHFLLTCTDTPRRPKSKHEKQLETRHYSSEEDSEATSAMAGTDTEDLVFCPRPFNKERLREQLEAGGGVVHSHFDDVPRNKYAVCKLIAPRPCLTAKYIHCLAADIRALTHCWVIASCAAQRVVDMDAHALPAGWSVQKEMFVNWVPASGKRNTAFFKDKLILLCGDQTFTKFWERVCTIASSNTRIVNEEELNMSGAIALLTEWDCPHEVQNKANEENIPLVSTTWVVQCLIEGRIISPTGHVKFSFMYTEPE